MEGLLRERARGFNEPLSESVSESAGIIEIKIIGVKVKSYLAKLLHQNICSNDRKNTAAFFGLQRKKRSVLLETESQFQHTQIFIVYSLQR